jgi:hypothetical protein
MRAWVDIVGYSQVETSSDLNETDDVELLLTPSVRSSTGT